MSLSVLLSQKYSITVLDIDEDRVKKINQGKSTIIDTHINEYIDKYDLDMTATCSKYAAFKDAEYVIVATPTDFDPANNNFNTESVDSTIKEALKLNNDCLIVIKSTIPIGHTKSLQNKYKTNRIIFSPEFLREGKAIQDNLYPSRIVIGGACQKSKDFGAILEDISLNSKNNIFYVDSSEAESIKLFSNAYLALRVSFFNELDSFALENKLNTENIIEGISSDPRIGQYYNNPSFGYGGYCLPKDTLQLQNEYNEIPQALIGSIDKSNNLRKKFLADHISKLKPKLLGIYRLEMKKGSDNFRSSAITDMAILLKNQGTKILIYEPLASDNIGFTSEEITKDLKKFKSSCDLFITNRIHTEIEDIADKLFSRDIFNNN